MTSVTPEPQTLQHTSSRKAKVLFFGRGQCDATRKAVDHLQRLNFDVTTIISNGRRESLPEAAINWQGEYIFCFRSLFILPKAILDNAGIAAINFHPGPTDYPGSGCINFALYDNATHYGVTAHLMSEKVDHGNILECRRFPISQGDSVDSLLVRTHTKLLDVFFDVASGIGLLGQQYISDRLKASAHEQWLGEARKMKELDQLSTVQVDISEAELERIVRATYTELFPPKLVLHGYEFVLNSSKKNKP